MAASPTAAATRSPGSAREVRELVGQLVQLVARAFKRSTGMAPYQYLTVRRIDRARDLLLYTNLPLADVAACAGFADQSHFTKVFRRIADFSPGHFRAARTLLR